MFFILYDLFEMIFTLYLDSDSEWMEKQASAKNKKESYEQ